MYVTMCGGQTLHSQSDAQNGEFMSRSTALRLALRGLLLALLALFVSACGTPETAAPAPTSAPAAAEQPQNPAANTAGELIVYTARAEALFKPVIEAFNSVYPDIKVTLLNGSNGELAAKILEERANPQADLLINSDTLTMASLAAEGVFSPNDSPTVLALPAGLRADDGSWLALTMRPRVIMYNTELVSPDELPTKLADLADPKWRGQIGSANSSNGALMAQLVVMRNQLGPEATEAFISGLLANETQFFGGHTDVRKAVGAGELKLGLVNHYYYHLSKAEGAPVGIIYPDQEEGGLGLIVNTTNAGIVQGGPNPTLARLFIEFMLSADGQRIYAEQNFEYPISADVALAEGVPPLSEFRLNNVTLKTMWDELEPTKELAQAAGLP
jgi:iron(III) transport system substrate-binding protein